MEKAEDVFSMMRAAQGNENPDNFGNSGYRRNAENSDNAECLENSGYLRAPGYPEYPEQTNYPEGKKYKLELIDTWEMTITELPEIYEGKIRIKMPAKQYMAVQMKEF